jgi:antitoxin (DNA-binding transcriptional repressor) of toxin-antitoxin stability system
MLQNVQTPTNYNSTLANEKTVALANARSQLSSLVADVQYREAFYVIKKNGEAVAALVPVFVMENWRESQKEFFKLLEEVQSKNANLNMTSEELSEFINKCVHEVKAQELQNLAK